MRFDYEWLCDWLEASPSPDALSEAITACGFTVELREPVGDDEVWDVEVTTNRPDAMNHRGLAREAVVALGVPLRRLETTVEESGSPASTSVSVDIAEPSLCGRYVARVVRGARIGPSPEWLTTRLERCGVRSINSVVDATNYILLGQGQPLHAFDLDQVRGRRIEVRRARRGERLVTIDDVERELDPEVLVIADAERAVAMAGVMGGAESEISEATTDILIESAWFEPVGIRRTARRFGLHTESSHRFERGCDPEMARTAADVAASLIAELAGGTVASGTIDVHPTPWSPTEVAFSVQTLCRFAGLDIDRNRAVEILHGLGLGPKPDDDRILCSTPSWRVDIELKEDLYEEVIRHVGYDAVPSELPVLSSEPGERRPSWLRVDRARDAAVEAGLIEVMTYSFIGADEDDLAGRCSLSPGDPVALENPLARTQAVMRRSLLPGAVAAARDSFNHGEEDLALFEQGRVFADEGDGVREAERLAVALSGQRGSWDKRRVVDLFEIKGIVEHLARRVGMPLARWERGGAPWLDEADGAIGLDGRGRSVVLAGRLADEMAARFDVRTPLFVAEIDLEAAEEPAALWYRELPKHPAVTVDLTVEHDVGFEYRALEEALRGLASDLVEEVRLVDRYAGRNVESGKVRTTVRLVYRHAERTLTQDEVNELHESLRGGLQQRSGLKLV